MDALTFPIANPIARSIARALSGGGGSGNIFSDAVWLTKESEHTVTRTGVRKSMFSTMPSLVENLVARDLSDWPSSLVVGAGSVSGTTLRTYSQPTGSDRAFDRYTSGQTNLSANVTYTVVVNVTENTLDGNTRIFQVDGRSDSFITVTAGETGRFIRTFTEDAAPGEIRIGSGVQSGSTGSITLEIESLIEGTQASDPFPIGSPAGTQAFVGPEVAETLARNLIPADPQLSDNIGVNTTITDNGDGSYRIQLPNGGGSFIQFESGLSLNGVHTLTFDWKETEGTSESGTARFFTKSGGAGEISYLPSSTPPSEWRTISATNHEVGNNILTLSDSGGVDITIRNIRFTPTAVPTRPFPIGSPAGTVLSDSRQYGSVYFTGVSDGAENLLQADLETTVGPACTVGPLQADGSKTLTARNASVYAGVHRLSNYTWGPTDLVVVFEAKAGTHDYLGFRAGDSIVSGNIPFVDLSNGAASPNGVPSVSLVADPMGDGWYRCVFTYLSWGGGPYLDIVLTTASGNEYLNDDGTASVSIRNFRVVAASSTYPAFADGTGAGESCGVDSIIATPSWTSEFTIVTLGVTYGYSGANNPAATEGRLLDGAFLLFDPANVRLQGLSGSPTITSGFSATDGDPFVSALDYNGATLGLRVNEDARQTQAETGSPSGSLRIGNRSSLAQPFHGVLAVAYFDRVLSDEEYSQARNELLNAWNNRELI